MLSQLPDWYEEYRKTQGFIFNDDGLFDVPDDQVEACDECGGSGLVKVTFRDPDDRPGIRKHVACRACGGHGFVEG